MTKRVLEPRIAAPWPPHLFRECLFGFVGALADHFPGERAFAAEINYESWWCDSGAMSITGMPDRALIAPHDVLERFAFLRCLFDQLSDCFETPIALDPLQLITERAGLLSLERQGMTACGSGAQLWRAKDGWVCASLGRAEDSEAIPAWLERDFDGDDWGLVEHAVRDRRIADLDHRAALLGLPVAILGSVPKSEPAVIAAQVDGPVRTARSLRDAIVVDLSSLWAGPLCARILGLCGARVIKVESEHRPDTMRSGSPTFFDLLHGSHESVVVDFLSSEGRGLLRKIIEQADIVIESSRPRAMEQLGITPHSFLDRDQKRMWISITGYGRSGSQSNRVAFGDDAAVAGGLVGYSNGLPVFFADAVADPTTGMTAAIAALLAWNSSGNWLLDAALTRTAAAFAQKSPIDARYSWLTDLDRPELLVSPPRRQVPLTSAPQLGEHSALVMNEVAHLDIP